MSRRKKEQLDRTAYCSFCRKSYQEVGPLVEGPGDVYICGECVELCQSIIEQEKRRRLTQGRVPSLPSVEVLQNQLNRCVGHQENATKALAAAARAHYQQLRDGGRDGAAPPTQSAIRFIGPSCSCKLFLARILAHALEVPVAQGEASRLRRWVSTVGAPEDLFFNLLQASDFEIEAAERGIAYIEGIDEPASQPVVQELLTERPDILFGRGLQIRTPKILFLCGGTFPGLVEVVRQRGRHPEQAVAPDDLRAWGMVPELINQFAAIISLAALGEDDLARVVPLVDLTRLTGGSN